MPAAAPRPDRPARAAAPRWDPPARAPLPRAAARLGSLAWLPLLALLALDTGCAAPRVARSVDGHVIVDRRIDARAYALYAIGAEAEARGDLATALQAYEQAEESDPDSADIWTRIGSVRCRRGEQQPADEAFARARAIDPDYEPAHREHARCDLAAGRLEAALGRAERAIALDPDRDDGLLLRAEILRRLGRTDDARRALRALLVRRPRSVDGWRALHALAVESGDRASAEQASRRLRELVPPGGAAGRPPPSRGALADLDEALIQGQLRRARRLARDADLPPAEVAVRAAALGRAGEAREQAELVSGADPASASALVALAVAADLSGDVDALTRACDALQAAAAGSGPAVPPSPLARLLFAELLFRRVGRDAALAWLGPLPPPGAADPLSQQIAQRVQRELGGGATAAPPRRPDRGATAAP
ncbi:tetratricopeptide repeat protein [Sorangium sp. So ce1024]|uniref:tetratricopeptide repeat protein n=1 Tax=Sorangium sp. So ce1024 TaxID=3133327 RepID=UPI003F07BF79